MIFKDRKLSHPIWYLTIYDYFRAKKLTRYITEDIEDIIIKSPNHTPLSKKEVTENEDQEVKYAMACTIIFTNVSDKVKIFIKDCKSAFQKMEKIKSLYQKDNSAFYGMWMNILYSIRVKDIHDTMNVANEIMELFRLLEDSVTRPSNLEQLSIMVCVSSKMTPGQLYDEIKDKYTLYSYKRERGNNSHNSTNNHKIKDNNDDMNKYNNTDDNMNVNIDKNIQNYHS
ncbi:hypothetical protein PIROE2DRAFT_2209 [Piromyces sp. E2]|nr:hypothetical protein PIROE2DRAFT_2209 [Piromyces sp. E2]|eukprot:OUM69786.1 hypothetical protein PIROE2DRAFT_2209 [Piromyces sp. E2]